MPPLSRAREFFSAYTQDLTSDELGKVFTRDAPEAYRFFTRGIDSKAFRALPRHTRVLNGALGPVKFVRNGMRMTLSSAALAAPAQNISGNTNAAARSEQNFLMIDLLPPCMKGRHRHSFTLLSTSLVGPTLFHCARRPYNRRPIATVLREE